MFTKTAAACDAGFEVVKPVHPVKIARRCLRYLRSSLGRLVCPSMHQTRPCRSAAPQWREGRQREGHDAVDLSDPELAEAQSAISARRWGSGRQGSAGCRQRRRGCRFVWRPAVATGPSPRVRRWKSAITAMPLASRSGRLTDVVEQSQDRGAGDDGR